MRWVWNIYGNSTVAQLFGYNSAEYNEEYLKPFDSFTHISAGGIFKTPFLPSFWVFGGNDDINVDDCNTYINTLKDNGYFTLKKVYPNKSHGEVTKPSDATIRKDITDFLSKFN